MTPYLLELPFPPSLNVYYQNRKARVARGASAGKVYTGKMISPEGIAFRGEAVRAVREGHRSPPRFSGRLEIFVVAVPPELAADKRTETGTRKNNNRRDLDNLWKCLLDALTKAEVFADDSLLDLVQMMRWNPCGKGRTVISIRTFDPDAARGAAVGAGIPSSAFERRIDTKYGPLVYGDLPF